MKSIRVFCDDVTVWMDKSLPHKIVQRLKNNETNEPYIKLELFNICWEFYIYGMNNTSMLPKKIKEASYDGCRPDIWFYDPQKDMILLAVEETSTAPVGNAQKQRIPRPLWAIDNGVPFIFVSPKYGTDNSQGKERKITGPFRKLLDKNSNSFITPEEYNLMGILFDISENNLNQYKIESPFNLDTLKKTKITVKGDTPELNKIKTLINFDVEVLNVIEERGNIFLVPKNSVTGKKLKLKRETILLIGMAWKSSNKSNGPSDPFAGGIMMVYYINKWFGSPYDVMVLSTHDCKKYNLEKLVKQTNKMTLALSKINKVMDLCGNIEEVSYVSNEIFEFKEVDESIATYCRYQELISENINVDFCQPPHGSWSSKDGMNTQKRDEKRGDIYYDGAPNGEEGKTKLSDIYKHIGKYGLIHDRYYYIIEDVNVKDYLKYKIHKVSFL